MARAENEHPRPIESAGPRPGRSRFGEEPGQPPEDAASGALRGRHKRPDDGHVVAGQGTAKNRRSHPARDRQIVRFARADLIADLMRVQSSPGSGWVALRACATLLAGLSILTICGRQELTAYVVFGAFACAYGGATRVGTRWQVQLTLGVLLTFAVFTGVVMGTTDHYRWLAVGLATGWAVVASLLSQRYGWRPPGPLFLVFAAATSAGMPVGAADARRAVLATSACASLAVVLGAIEVRVLGAQPRPTVASEVPMIDRSLPLICGAGALIAGAVATLAGLDHPSWAMVAAVAPFSVIPPTHQIVRAIHRVVGTAVGLAVAALILVATPLPAIPLILLVTALHAATEMLVVRHYGLALVFITPLALLLTQLADPVPRTQLLTSRIVETVVGVLVGLTVAVLVRRGFRIDKRT